MPRSATSTKVFLFEPPPMVASEWRTSAACRFVNPEQREDFFPLGYDWATPVNQARADRAKTICSGCSVRAECGLDAAAAGDPWAIRGGTTPLERSPQGSGRRPS